MQIRELSKPVTSKVLNESLAKNFGYKLNLEQFSDVQLEDARNKLRTELSQLELSETYDSLPENAKYQKSRMFLDVINQEIMEREEGKCETCHKDPCECDDKEGEEEKMTSEHVTRYLAQVMSERAQERGVPAKWISSAYKRIRLGESDAGELKAELQVRYNLKESVASYILAEGEEDKAKVIMATKDMVDRVTGWLEDTAQMKAEQLLELLDSIRESFGSDVAQQYQDQVKPALEAVYTALETSRSGLSGALAIVSGGEAPTMGAPAGAMGATPPAPGADAGLGGEMPPEAGAEEATPPAPEEERMKRESVDYSRRLGMLLASKKK